MTLIKPQNNIRILNSTFQHQTLSNTLIQHRFITYKSFYSKKCTEIQSQRHAAQPNKVLRNQFFLLQAMRSQEKKIDLQRNRLNQQNINDLAFLIMKQGHNSSLRQRERRENCKINKNEACLKIYQGLKSYIQNECQYRNFTIRSRSSELSQIPAKVKIFKKMSLFNKHQNLKNQQKGKYSKYVLSNDCSKEKPLKSNQKLYLKANKINLKMDRKQQITDILPLSLKKYQSKGEMISKQKETKKKINKLRHMSLLQKQVQNRQIQPAFLQQI